MANILITGANGSIASHVSKLMESLGHRIVPIEGFRGICEQERPTHVFHAAHPPRDETPAVLNYCYDAMTNILEAPKS
jgi:hypothetical protein